MTHRGFKITSHGIRDAEIKGRIKREPDGSFDLEKVIQQLGENTKLVKPGFNDYLAGAQVPTGGNSGSGQPSYTAARTARELIEVKTRNLKLQVAEGRLVDKAKALAAVEELAAEFRDHWLSFSARHSGEIAAELNVEPNLVGRVLDRFIVEHARSLGAPSIEDRVFKQ